MASSKCWWIPSIFAIYCLNTVIATCSNSTHQCYGKLTCCGSTTDASLCCPYQNAVCCTNGLHCCPESSQCHPDKGICVSRTKMGIPLLQNLHSVVPLHQQGPKHRPRLEVCPSKKMMCPSKSTCCPGPYIGYDCCPMSLGVCCEDFRHCCPFNTTCDTKNRQCINHGGQLFPWYKKLKAEISDLSRVKKIQLIKSNQLVNNTCSDGTTKCNSHEKCCSSNGYSCCPLVNARCCTDGIHCCPNGSECDTFTKPPTCIRRNGFRIEAFHTRSIETKWKKHHLQEHQVKATTNKLFTPTTNASATIICPGGKYSCPDYMTCCPQGKGKFGCCPLPHAVCCSDRWHCCPEGSTCDLKHSRCIRGGLFIPLFTKMKAIKVDTPHIETNQECPDKSECPDIYTCCQLPSQKYGCCPLSQAVCCADHIHCCPHGTVCDLTAKTCKAGQTFTSFHNIHRKRTNINEDNLKNVKVSICPGGLFECPDDTTCCPLAEGWACCPFNKGICCKDRNHCCPNGYICDLKEARCITGNTTVHF